MASPPASPTLDERERHDTSPAKRARTDEPDWTITFDDAGSLRLIVEAVSAVMQRVMFCVRRRSSGAAFLEVDGADVGFNCCVSARFQLDAITVASEESATEGFSFCVECKHLLIALETTSCVGGSVEIAGLERSAKVRVTIKDPDVKCHKDVSHLSTYVDGDPDFHLTPMDFKMLLEMDVGKLREMIKKAKKSHAEHLRIQIYLSEETARKRSRVCLTVQGENQDHGTEFCNELKHDEDGSARVRAAADGEDEDLFHSSSSSTPVFDATFPVERIESFVRNVPVRMIKANVGPGLPIMLTHDLKGATDGLSYIRFLVAAVNDDDE